MSSQYINPFRAKDADRYFIWEMLVYRDIIAFLAADWSMIESDYAEDRFMGVHCHESVDPGHWNPTFPSLGTYRDEWLRQAREFGAQEFLDDPRTTLFSTTILGNIEVSGSRAIAQRKYDGAITKSNSEKIIMKWQTLYYCHHVNGRWKIAGFNGYLPNPMG